MSVGAGGLGSKTGPGYPPFPQPRAILGGNRAVLMRVSRSEKRGTRASSSQARVIPKVEAYGNGNILRWYTDGF